MADEEAIVVDDNVTSDSTPLEDQAIDLTDESASEEQEESTAQDEGTEDQNEEEGSEAPAESEEAPEEPKSKGEQRKDQLNGEIRDLVAQRNKIRQQVEQLNQQAYQVPTPDQIMEQVNPETGEYYNRLEAQMMAMQQERAVEKYNNQVAEAQLSLQSEATRALNDFPAFDEQSPEYNKDIAEQADALLMNALQRDPRTGQIVGSSISPYALYKTLNDSIQSAKASGQVAAQKAQSQMLANTDVPKGAAEVKQPKKDAFMDGFDREW